MQLFVMCFCPSLFFESCKSTVYTCACISFWNLSRTHTKNEQKHMNKPHLDIKQTTGLRVPSLFFFSMEFSFQNYSSGKVFVELFSHNSADSTWASLFWGLALWNVVGQLLEVSYIREIIFQRIHFGGRHAPFTRPVVWPNTAS